MVEVVSPRPVRDAEYASGHHYRRLRARAIYRIPSKQRQPRSRPHDRVRDVGLSTIAITLDTHSHITPTMHREAAAIDYGSIALVRLFAAPFLWAPIERAINPPDLPLELGGIGTLIGLGLVVLAMKMWRDVRDERRRGL